MEKNPNNPSYSCPSQPIQPMSSPLPQNLTGPSGSNRVYVSNGIPPPPNSSFSNNSVRKPRGRNPKSQDKNILPPPENTRLSAPPAQRPLLLQPPLPHPLQQREWAQGQLVSPRQQNIQPQAQMLQPMQHTHWPRAQLVPPLQQNQGWQAHQFSQPKEQIQWAQAHHRHSPPQKMQRVSYYSKLVAEVMHYQWERPKNNCIEYWSQYVARYYDPNARERWCLSKCKDIMIPIRKDGRSCMLCGWMPQKGYEVSFEELPGRLKTKFDRMLGDRLSPGKAQEHKSKNGVTIVLYPNATHQCMYALECVIYTGLLRLVITDQRKVLEWEFCVSDRKTYVKIQRPLSSCPDNLLGIGEILRRPEAKNISDERTEENLLRNSQMEATQPRADTNVSRSTGIMQQANSLEHRIKQTTMNVSRATLSNPTSHDGSNQQNADRMSGKRPVSVNANSSETSGWSYEYMVTCLLTNASANLEQEISQNAMSNLQARHPGDSSSHMIVGRENTYEVSGDGVTGSMKMAQAAAASPVESREADLIPDPAVETQAQDIPVMENPASTDQSPTNRNTASSQRVMDDLQVFIQKLNDDEFEMLNNFKSDDYDRTEATPLENEVDRETYLVESTPCPQA